MAGAYGSFLASLLIANPKSTGVLFDQPQVSLNNTSTPCAALSIALPSLPYLAPGFFAPQDVIMYTVGRHTHTPARFPTMRSVQVIARAIKLWEEEAKKASVARRTTFMSGDFFKAGGLTSLELSPLQHET